jgi:ribosomal-protein-serine acetyltransferase
MSGLPYEIIEINPRLRLRQLKLADADRLFSLVEADREYLAKYLPWVDETTELEHSRKFVTSMLEKRESGDQYGYGIEYDGIIIGHTSIMHLKDGMPEIGYWIGSDYQGNGIMTTVASSLTDFTLNTLNRNEVIICAEPENIGSNRVAEKCGYHLDGEKVKDGKVLNIWKISAS